MNPFSLTVEEVARLLSGAGGIKVSVEEVQADLDAGAPRNPDGTMNLLHYAAWMLKEEAGT